MKQDNTNSKSDPIQKAHALLMDVVSRMDTHDQRIEKLEIESPSDDKVAGVVQGVMAAVDARIKTAMEKDKAEDQAQLNTIVQLFQETIMRMQAQNDAYQAAMMEAVKDSVNDRKAIIALATALAKPRKRSGEVTLPTGKVKMIISEMMDS